MPRDGIDAMFSECEAVTRAEIFRAGFLAARRLAVEECGKPQEYAMPIPCPDGKPGCLVLHTVPARRPKTAEECAAAIERLGESPAPGDG